MTKRPIGIIGSLLLAAFSAGAWAEEAPPAAPSPLLQQIQERAVPLGDADDLDALLDAIGDRRAVLLGEASHGTAEFYTWRTEISGRLIAEKGFRFIAVEGDWANCWEVNRYVKHLGGAAASAREALTAFDRWPEWMWNNRQVEELVEWLHEHNAELPPDQRAGFYGIDLYTPWQSIAQALDILGEADPELAAQVEEHYACLTAHAEPQQYAQAIAHGADSCAPQAEAAFRAISAGEESLRAHADKTFLAAKQNAAVVLNAERHYRAMADPRLNSWNKRARHFFETFDRLLRFHGEGAKGIVWAHNTHIGDARATDMARIAQVNIGQLARESYGPENVFAVGFGTHRGTVIAGRQWGAPLQTMTVPHGMPGSWEHLLNQLPHPAFYFVTEDSIDAENFQTSPIRHRAIGVVYNPEREHGNYVNTLIPARYDAFIFIAETAALDPL